MLENKIQALESIAEGLKDRLTEFVFVVGAVTELYSSKSLIMGNLISCCGLNCASYDTIKPVLPSWFPGCSF